MSELYDQSEQDFCANLSSINRKADNIQQHSKETKEAALSEAKTEFTEAESNLKQMELELLGFGSEQRAQREAKLREYRQELEEAKRAFLKLQDNFTTKKNQETVMGANLEEVKHYEVR
mmetsp:Transcript_36415/g.35285  ORF Transcript_36415/g.35285 Transcript_36415/m.35285 type:complete len:119 (+) Transcript_36415:16-372(+)